MSVLAITLAIGAVNGFVLAIVLALAPGNKAANRILSLLIAALAWRLGPYICGFAGLYDAHPWLTFFPFDLSFAFGPLLWLYVRVLTSGAPPAQWRWHFAPALAQLGYWLICFALPLAEKWSWYTGAHLHIVAPIGAAAVLISCAAYLYGAYRDADNYRTWLDSAFANKDEARLWSLRVLLLAFLAALALAIAFALTSWFVRPLSYFDRFPLMVVFAILTYGLGLLGWRNANVVFVRPDSAPAETPPQPAPDTGNAYAAQAAAWRDRLVAEGWWRDETLDLAGLAVKLGASERTLSRTLSEGLGQNFRELLGRIRVDAVAAALDGDADTPLLTLALAAGFNSKASFNRAFQAYRGVTPSAYRQRAKENGLKNRQSQDRAGFEAI